MIGKLTGTIDSIGNAHIVIDVQGVGYVVACSAHTLRQIGGVGEPACLLIETHVREDAINLYGFAQTNERNWFRLLTTVQGVGAKSALAILGVLAPDRLAQAIAAQDKTALTQAEGVGPKLGLRIVTELKDKAALVPGESAAASLAGRAASPTGEALSAAMAADLASDAVSALVNLGYKRMDAYAAVTKAAQTLAPSPEGDIKLESLIRAGLTELSAQLAKT